jgi:hypothetical protein
MQLSWVVPKDAPLRPAGPWLASGFTESPAPGAFIGAFAFTHEDVAGYAAAPCFPGGPPVLVTVSVRSESDPYVKAAVLTDWSFDFGCEPRGSCRVRRRAAA